MKLKFKRKITYDEFRNSILTFQDYFLFKPNEYGENLQKTSDFLHQEYHFEVSENTHLHGVLFKSSQPFSKGLVFYLHGNKAIVDNLDVSLAIYLNQGYDLFAWDYRGYGKSGGKIINEAQFYADAQIVFNELSAKLAYPKLVLLGYSLGSGLAVKLAADNTDKVDLLILNAPYYSIVDVIRRKYFPLMPRRWVKFPLESYKHVSKIKAPVVIFHGKKDSIIHYKSSVKLKELLKENDELYIIDDLLHSPFDQDEFFRQKLSSLLSEN